MCYDWNLVARHRNAPLSRHAGGVVGLLRFVVGNQAVIHIVVANPKPNDTFGVYLNSERAVLVVYLRPVKTLFLLLKTEGRVTRIPLEDSVLLLRSFLEIWMELVKTLPESPACLVL